MMITFPSKNRFWIDGMSQPNGKHFMLCVRLWPPMYYMPHTYRTYLQQETADCFRYKACKYVDHFMCFK